MESPFTGNFKRELEGSGKEASLSAGALLGEPRGEVPFLRIRKEGSGDRHHSPWGNLAGGSFVYWGLEKSLEMGTFLHRPC